MDSLDTMMMQMPIRPSIPSTKKPKGKMTPYACFVKVIRAEHKKKHPDEHIVFAEFSKKCAEKWSQMSDKEKKRFQEMSLKDKDRYEREMEAYEPPPGEPVGRKIKKKRTKDPNAPKRALSAFMWFCKDARKEVKEVSPELRMGEIAKVLSVKWKECIDRTIYDGQADVDKQRYQEAMKIYKSQKLSGKLGTSNVQNVPAPTAVVSQKRPEESDSESDESGSDDDMEDDEA